MSNIPRSLAVVLGAFLFASTFTPTDAFAKKDKSAEAEADAGATFEVLPIEETGISAFDDVFMKAKAINDKLTTSHDNIVAANDNIVTALGLTKGSPVGDAIAQLKKDAPGMLTVTMDGMKPAVDVQPDAPDNVKNAVAAINGASDALVSTSAALATIPGEAKALVDACKEFPAKVPAIAKEAGLKATEIPSLLKKVKNNVKATGQIPNNTKVLVDTTGDTLNIIKSLAD